jgi:hypothetical protein
MISQPCGFLGHDGGETWQQFWLESRRAAAAPFLPKIAVAYEKTVPQQRFQRVAHLWTFAIIIAVFFKEYAPHQIGAIANKIILSK